MASEPFLFPLAPPVLRLSSEGHLGRESCVVPSPLSALLLDGVTGTGHQQDEFGLDLSQEMCSRRCAPGDLFQDNLFQELALCTAAADGLFIHGLLTGAGAKLCSVCGWTWGSQHRFVLLTSPLLSSALCSYRHILFLLKLCLGKAC